MPLLLVGVPSGGYELAVYLPTNWQTDMYAAPDSPDKPLFRNRSGGSYDDLRLDRLTTQTTTMATRDCCL